MRDPLHPSPTGTFTRQEAANLAWGNLRQLGGVLESPTIKHRNTIATIDNREGGSRPVVRSPYRMSESDTSDPGEIATRGEHNYDVLSDWLDMSLSEVDQLVIDKVLLHDEWAAKRGD
jgi:crotonobetainyl-CoA:carnitine CoA-transferase CaiB-like acyl-CoA transferase